MKVKILIIEDELSIRNLLKSTLEADKFEVVVATSGEEGLSLFKSGSPNLIILDYGLPGIQGITVLEEIRKSSQVPVIFLTARDSDDDKVAALDAGADDYLTKPFSVTELMARIRVGLRHSLRDGKNEMLNFGKLRVDLGLHRIYYDDVDLKLTGTEFDLLKILIISGGKIVPHKVILNDVWGPHSVDQLHYLRVYFGVIRKKLESACTGASTVIVNEAGIGYRLKDN